MAVSDMRIQVGGTDGEVYELSVTTEARVSARNTISKYKTESRDVITENAVVNNREITYNGIITSIRRTDQGTGGDSFNVTGAILPSVAGIATGGLGRRGENESIGDFFDRSSDSNFKDPRTFLEGLDQVRKDREFVTCFLPNNLTPISDCLIEYLEYTKDQSGGLTSWNVNIRLYEVRLTQRAVETTIPAPVATGNTEPRQDAGNATVEELAPRGLSTTIGVNPIQGANNFFGGLG